MAGPVVVLDWRPLRNGSGGLVGFVRVQFGSGLIIDEVRVFVRGGRTWCSPPARPMTTKTGEPLLNDRGKQGWAELVSFATHGVRSSWSRQILTALRQQFPDALPSQEAA
jgi:hypothetical protein